MTVKFCWLCGKNLYQRKVGVTLKVDGEWRTLHKICARKIDDGGDYIKKVEYFSAEWRVENDDRPAHREPGELK